MFARWVMTLQLCLLALDVSPDRNRMEGEARAGAARAPQPHLLPHPRPGSRLYMLTTPVAVPKMHKYREGSQPEFTNFTAPFVLAYSLSTHRLHSPLTGCSPSLPSSFPSFSLFKPLRLPLTGRRKAPWSPSLDGADSQERTACSTMVWSSATLFALKSASCPETRHALCS